MKIEKYEVEKEENIQEEHIFNRLPYELLAEVLIKLEPTERMNMRQTSKEMNEKADADFLWKKDCQHNGVDATNVTDNYKQLFFRNVAKTNSDDYYIVGDSIKPSSEVSSEEILALIPKSDQVRVFRDINHAKAYAKSQATIGDDCFDSVKVIFTVSIKENLFLDKQTDEVTPKNIYTYMASRYAVKNRPTISIEYINLDLKHIKEYKAGLVPHDDIQDIQVDFNHEKANSFEPK